jgi:CBS domain-containing protein
MTTVRQILEAKGHDVHAVGPDDAVLKALQLMADRDLGSVLVMDGDELVGIFTERSYARNVFLKGRSSPETAMRAVMEPNVVCVRPEDTAEACMALMSEKRIRHLPVVSEGRVLGVISIGDLMRGIIEEREFNIDQLVSYVSG